jgi:hypothetical protein
MTSLIAAATSLGLSIGATLPSVLATGRSESAALLLQGIGLLALASFARRQRAKDRRPARQTAAPDSTYALAAKSPLAQN